jgi:uncharacterized protein YneF (UPF0154 family)
MRYAGLAGAIGMDLVVCILLGYFGGAWISDRTGQRAWMAAGVLLGLFIGLAFIVLLIKRFLEDTHE